ncbi:hypothetical protein F5887DRAFT_1164959, partial [Amanita rubescens]
MQSSTTSAANERFAHYPVHLPLRGESAVGALCNIPGIVWNPDNVAPTQPWDNNPGNHDAARDWSQYMVNSHNLRASVESTFGVPENGNLEKLYTGDFSNVARARAHDPIIDENPDPRNPLPPSILANPGNASKGPQYAANPHNLPPGGEPNGSPDSDFLLNQDNVALAQPCDPIIDENSDPTGNHFPSPVFANVDGIFFQSTADLRSSPPEVPPSSPDTMYVSLANRRRTKQAKYHCPVIGCDHKGFTAMHNLRYHLNTHNHRRPYKCKHKDWGCDFSAVTPGTATRHSRTCKHKP